MAHRKGKSKEASKVILGIDPGTNVMGFGVIETMGREIQVISHGTVDFDRKEHHLIRLKQIFKATNELIDKFLPDELAIEAPF